MEKCKALDLKIFCYKGEYFKENLGVPWSEGKYSYASDGVILIRVVRFPDIPENEQARSVNRVTDFLNKGVDTWVQVPNITPEKKFCSFCGGKGFIYFSDIVFGKTKENCEDCDGTGYIDKEIVVEIEEVFFNNKYLRMLLTLPGVKMALLDKIRAPAKIKFDGGDGLLMPMLAPDRYSDVKIITLNPIIGC